jgi:hypothetical protein
VDFKSGDKVVCVIPTTGAYSPSLQLGNVYTVESLVGVNSVFIVEVSDWYDQARFRLATELEKALS